MCLSHKKVGMTVTAKRTKPADPAKPTILIDQRLTGTTPAEEAIALQAIEAARRRGYVVQVVADIPPDDTLLLSPNAHFWLPDMWDLFLPILKERAKGKRTALDAV